MPVWVGIYLLIVTVICAFGLRDEFIEGKNKIVLTNCFITPFLLTYFSIVYFTHFLQPSVYEILFFLVLGVIIEFKATDIEMKREENKSDQEFEEKVNFTVNNLVLFINAVIVVPGYVFGFLYSVSL